MAQDLVPTTTSSRSMTFREAEAKIETLHGRLEPMPSHPNRFVVPRSLAATTTERRALSAVRSRLEQDLAPWTDRDAVEVIVTRLNLNFEIGRVSDIDAKIRDAKQGKTPDLGEGPICEPAKGRQGQVTLWIKQQVECGAGPDGEPWYVTQDSTTTPVRAGQYRPGTFCKLHWIRGADDVAEDRAAYAFEHAALVRLAQILDGKLSYIAVKPPISPPTPWIAKPPSRRVLLSVVETKRDPGTPAVKAVVPTNRMHTPVRQIELATSAPLLAA